MKKIIFFGFASLIISCFSSVKAQSFSGVWVYNTDSSVSFAHLDSLVNIYHIKGDYLTLKWQSVQPAPNTFNWAFVDSQIARIARANLFYDLQIWVGPASPSWIYNAPYNVDSVKTKDNNHFAKYPYYFNKIYDSLWYNMIDSVATHVSKLDSAIRSKLLIYQSAEGTTGDLSYYKGNPVKSKYDITKAQWTSFVTSAWKHTDSVYKSKKDKRGNSLFPDYHLMINTGISTQVVNTPPNINPDSSSCFVWAEINLPDAWRKATESAHFYQSNFEKPFKDSFGHLINNPFPSIRCRDELDTHQSICFTKTPQYVQWNGFCTAACALYFGTDIWCVKDTQLAVFKMPIDFFNKYAASKNPVKASYAFCLLRDGLDASDTLRFSTAQYGAGTAAANDKKGMTRCTNIADQFSAFGAAQPDPPHGQGGPISQLVAATDINDVGWYIFPDNYEKFLRQIDPGKTDQGYWRITTPQEPNSIYGRFARGFNAAQNKDSLFFNIEDNFAGTAHSQAGFTDTIRIVYYDSTTHGGRFNIYIDSVNEPNHLTKTIFLSNTHTWDTLTIVVKNSRLNNGCLHGADFFIANNKAHPSGAIFALIEVSKPVLSEADANLYNSAYNKRLLTKNIVAKK